MAKNSREKLKKTKARKDKKAKAVKAARVEAKSSGEATASASSQGQPFGVDSVGRSIAGSGGGMGTPRMPRRSKKG